MRVKSFLVLIGAGLLATLSSYATETDYSLGGNLQKWQPVVIDFRGPVTSASNDAPNPFLDYRLQVRFRSPDGVEYDVPGYYDGDGDGGLSGDVWRVAFSPDETGDWAFRASFREGDQVAIQLEPDAGEPVAFDGTVGTLTVAPQDDEAPGFYRWGRLEYAGGFYLKFRDGDYWIKGGTDSPEDFLAYNGFADTPRATHRYDAHVADWNQGDPDWDDGKGKGIIGALNYLASMKVNSIYFLVMNIGGDGKNVWPYLGDIDGGGSPNNDDLHFDVTKLRQWGIVFDHAQRKGIMLHFVLNEAEEPNKRELDDGQLGVERKLYYRELVARFGHFPALQWNLSEEYNLGFAFDPEVVKSFAQYIRDVDPYDHPVTVHHAGKWQKAWTPFLGDNRFQVTSFQVNKLDVVEAWRKQSREAGFPQVIGMDEFFPDKTNPNNIDRQRREYLWPIYFSGGNVEFILDDLLKTEDFRKYRALWQYMAYARSFMETHLPFREMEPRDELLTGESEFTGENNVVEGQVFAKDGEIYAVYLPVASDTGTLDMTQAPGSFTKRWFNPRSGEFVGDPSPVQGGTAIVVGAPPGEAAEDWVLLLTRQNAWPVGAE